MAAEHGDMKCSTRTPAKLLALCLLVSSAAVAQGTPVALNFNFNGILHAGEAGLPDDPMGFRSISDRALDFRNGVPIDPILVGYQLVDIPGVLDIVHLGNRNQHDAGNWAFDPAPDGDNIGTQPTWLASVDQSGPQTTVLQTPLTVTPGVSLGFLYQISNGGGSFDVTVTFASGATLTESLAGADWYFGSFPGTGSVDSGNQDQNLSLTEGRVDLASHLGDAVTEITFSNRSNSNGGVAIVACNFGVKAASAAFGAGCVREFASFYEQVASESFDLTNMDMIGVSSGGGYVVVTSPGIGPLPIGSLDPTGGTMLLLPDDGQTPAGTLGLSVGSNGWLARGTGNSNASTAAPQLALNNPRDTVYAWNDLLPNSAGMVVYEEDAAAGQARVTYDGVLVSGTQDPCYIQIDYNVVTADWVLRFGAVGFTAPQDWFVGYSPGGPSLDPGPVDISAAAVIATQPFDTAPLGLAPMTSPLIGSVWTVEVTDVPPPTVFGVSILGASDPGIVDLGALGMPGCQLRSSLDVLVGPWSPIGSAYTYGVSVPTNNALIGSAIYTQAATFSVPAVNAFGAITSNGVVGVVGSF